MKRLSVISFVERLSGAWLLYALIAIWALAGTVMRAQDDTWWHLRTGEEIVSRASIPLTDIYSWVLPPGTYWPNHEWLSQVVFYLVYRLGGVPLVDLLGGLMLGLAALLLASSMKGGALLRSVLLLVVLLGILPSLSLRAHVLTIFCFSLSVFLVSKERFWILVPIFLLWANLHGAVSLGGLCLIAACTAGFICRDPLRRKLLIVTLLCGVAVSIQPLGSEIYLFPLRSVQRIGELPLDEWQPVRIETYLGKLFWLMTLALVAALLYAPRQLRDSRALGFFLMTVFLFPLALQHQRNVSLWLMVTVVSISYLIRVRRPFEFGFRRMALFSILFVSAASALLQQYRPLYDRRLTPITKDGISIIRSLKQPIFTSYNAGGYVIWFAPDVKVFIDSRQDPYPLELLKETIEVQRTGDYGRLFDTYQFESVIVEEWMPLTGALLRDGWQLRYRSLAFVVLERNRTH